MEETPKVKCPKCGSEQIFAGTKGFSGGKAVAGALLTGGVGLLAGTIGSGKLKLTCMVCGHVFKPGDKPIIPAEKKEPSANDQNAGCFGIIIILIALYFIFKGCN